MLARNFAVMTGVNAGLQCAIKKARGGVEDVQGRCGSRQAEALHLLARDSPPRDAQYGRLLRRRRGLLVGQRDWGTGTCGVQAMAGACTNARAYALTRCSLARRGRPSQRRQAQS